MVCSSELSRPYVTEVKTAVEPIATGRRRVMEPLIGLRFPVRIITLMQQLMLHTCAA